jgi:hypothetical protein
MKKLIFVVAIICTSITCFSQSKLLSYEDVKYLIRNDLNQADTFLVAKGYKLKSKNIKKKYSEYTMPRSSGLFVNVNLRMDGRRMFLEVETTDVAQYNLILNSILQYPHKFTLTGADIETYTIKDLFTAYIITNEVVPYSPIIKNYSIQIVPDKNAVADRDLN